MQQRQTIVLGTHNRKKGLELAQLLGPLHVLVRTLADFDNPLTVSETGNTFLENAVLKATAQARHLGAWVLGEDSGLCVEALNGTPGIYSARFAGNGATDEKNNQKLLEMLRGVPPERRLAHYTCAAVVSDPDGNEVARNEGVCRGRIREAPSGDGGFGYDPLFEILEYHKTFGELGAEVKAALSHRGRAIRGLIPQLIALWHVKR